MSEQSPEISGDLNNGNMFASGGRNLELGSWGKRYIFTRYHFVQFEFCKTMHVFNYLFKTHDNYVNKYIKGNWDIWQDLQTFCGCHDRGGRGCHWHLVGRDHVCC